MTNQATQETLAAMTEERLQKRLEIQHAAIRAFFDEANPTDDRINMELMVSGDEVTMCYLVDHKLAWSADMLTLHFKVGYARTPEKKPITARFNGSIGGWNEVETAEVMRVMGDIYASAEKVCHIVDQCGETLRVAAWSLFETEIALRDNQNTRRIAKREAEKQETKERFLGNMPELVSLDRDDILEAIKKPDTEFNVMRLVVGNHGVEASAAALGKDTDGKFFLRDVRTTKRSLSEWLSGNGGDLLGLYQEPTVPVERDRDDGVVVIQLPISSVHRALGNSYWSHISLEEPQQLQDLVDGTRYRDEAARRKKLFG